jgi:hypothetical protein
MGNSDLSYWETHGRFKTKRVTTRLRKKDKEKYLIQLSKKRDRLWVEKRALPIIPLEHPYQKGWVRSFVLRDDIARSNEADFYQGILNKINTETFSSNKNFKKSKRRYGKKVLETKPQYLKDISIYEWQHPKIPFSDKERARFYKRELPNWKETVIVYSFDQAWRFVLKIKPNIITHTQQIDCELESNIKELDNHIKKNGLNHKINRLTHCRKQAWKSCRGEKEKYRWLEQSEF